MREFPAIESKHLLNAKLYATREDMLSAIAPRPTGCVAEVGVARGDFSAHIISVCQPKAFIAFDLFDMHQYPSHWGVPSGELFNGLTHREFYERRFAREQSDIVIELGESRVTLSKYPDEYFDFIYLDGDHAYDAVKIDSVNAAKKLKRSGLLIFNDYTMYDGILSAEYGVVPAVNELVVLSRWRIVGFALQRHMFCDIAVVPP